MKRVLTVLVIGIAAGLVAGCGDKTDNKQPKLVGTPDPKIQGPAQISGGGGGKAGAKAD